MTTPEPASEDDLVNAARDGDIEAFGALVDAHYPVTALVAGFVTGQQQAQEAVHSVWLAITDALRRNDGSRPDGMRLRAWTCALLVEELDRRQALDQTEGNNPLEPELFLQAGDRWAGWWQTDVTAWMVSGEESSPSDAVRQVVIDAVTSLPTLQRVMVLLHDVAGLSLDECAPIVGQTVQAQETLLHWARSRVQQALDRRFAGQEQRI